ncbi:MAG: polysaccharide biosynthesis/export family protein [Pseudomonadota bacterium]
MPVVKFGVFWRAAALLILAVFAVSCAAYKPLDPAFHKALKQPYTLDSGDVLRVTVFSQEDLTNTYQVDKGGHLALPLIGSVAARGKTPKQMEGLIAAGLRNGFLRNPDVSVEVATYRPFFILGEVGTAGQYTYVPGMTVQTAIAIAGGFTARAQQADADVTRNVNGEIITGRVPISDPILPGDTIAVRERLF